MRTLALDAAPGQRVLIAGVVVMRQRQCVCLGVRKVGSPLCEPLLALFSFLPGHRLHLIEFFFASFAACFHSFPRCPTGTLLSRSGLLTQATAAQAASPTRRTVLCSPRRLMMMTDGPSCTRMIMRRTLSERMATRAARCRSTRPPRSKLQLTMAVPLTVFGLAARSTRLSDLRKDSSTTTAPSTSPCVHGPRVART